MSYLKPSQRLIGFNAAGSDERLYVDPNMIAAVIPGMAKVGEDDETGTVLILYTGQQIFVEQKGTSAIRDKIEAARTYDTELIPSLAGA